MIRSGHREGWLSLPLSTFQPWAQLNDIELNGIKITEISGRGAGVIASRSFGAGDADVAEPHDASSPPETLMKIPQDMVLSKEAVRRWAAHDAGFKELLDACPSLIEVGSPGVLCKIR